MPPQDPACYHSRAGAAFRPIRTSQCPCSLSPTRLSIRCWCISARSPSAGTRSPTSSASCSAGPMPGSSSVSGKLWGGKAPLTVTDFDDFVLWVTLGIILGRPHRLRAVLQPAAFRSRIPLEIFQLWNGGMSFHGGFTGCVVAVLLFGYRRGIPVLSLGRHHLRSRTDRIVSRPHRQFHQRRTVGPAVGRAVGDDFSKWRAVATAPKPAL